MRRGFPFGWIAGAALVLALAGPESARSQPRHLTPAPAKEKKTAGKGGKTQGKPDDRLKLDPRKVLALQMQALNAQSDKEGALIQRQNRATRWLDNFHRCWYCRMDNAVRRVDTQFLTEDARYDPELSTFKLKLMTRMGGKSSEGDFDMKVRFRADVALPGLEKRLHLFLDNAGRDSLPGQDPMKQESDTRLGVRAALKTMKDSELSLGGGLRWREAHPVAYTALDWMWDWKLDGGTIQLNPRGVYYSDEGFGQKVTLSWTRPSGKKKLFQIRLAERSAESLEGVEFEQSLRFAWLRSGKGRGWVAQASVFPHLVSSDWIWDDSLVNITWRDALYRKWIYYTITPQVQFPKEDEYQPKPSLRIGLEILFGGKIGDLM